MGDLVHQQANPVFRVPVYVFCVSVSRLVVFLFFSVRVVCRVRPQCFRYPQYRMVLFVLDFFFLKSCTYVPSISFRG